MNFHCCYWCFPLCLEIDWHLGAVALNFVSPGLSSPLVLALTPLHPIERLILEMNIWVWALQNSCGTLWKNPLQEYLESCAHYHLNILFLQQRKQFFSWDFLPYTWYQNCGSLDMILLHLYDNLALLLLHCILKNRMNYFVENLYHLLLHFFHFPWCATSLIPLLPAIISNNCISVDVIQTRSYMKNKI